MRSHGGAGNAVDVHRLSINNSCGDAFDARLDETRRVRARLNGHGKNLRLVDLNGDARRFNDMGAAETLAFDGALLPLAELLTVVHARSHRLYDRGGFSCLKCHSALGKRIGCGLQDGVRGNSGAGDPVNFDRILGEHVRRHALEGARTNALSFVGAFCGDIGERAVFDGQGYSDVAAQSFGGCAVGAVAACGCRGCIGG